MPPGEDVCQAWEKFFARHEPEKNPAKLKGMDPDALKAYQLRLVRQQQAVLETVQKLKEAVAAAVVHDRKDEAKKKHEEIVALIEAALRHDQAQPWMYEILALSMKAAGRPQEEIDRAIMSAAEFVQGSSDLLYLGAYLAQVNMDRRALQIFRQVAMAEPLWPEPYYYGMLAARKLDDLPGKEWATAGILGQAWLPAQAHVWEDANRVAEATLEGPPRPQAERGSRTFPGGPRRGPGPRLRRHGAVDRRRRHRRYGQGAGGHGLLAPQFADHQRRDADPRRVGGQGQRRRTHGRLLLPESLQRQLPAPGPPRLRQAAHGQRAGQGRTHYNTKKAVTLEKKIPLGSSEALVKFDVADGRRKESVQEQQVVNAAVAAVAQKRVTQQILAQQLAAANDPAAAAALATVQQAAASSGQAQSISPLAFPSAWPNGLHGAVGYTPIIITLPEGTNLAATAVISADRRYVRITSVPLFSAVSNVVTFSMDNGATNNVTGQFQGGNNGNQGAIGNNPANNIGGGIGNNNVGNNGVNNGVNNNNGANNGVVGPGFQ